VEPHPRYAQERELTQYNDWTPATIAARQSSLPTGHSPLVSRPAADLRQSRVSPHMRLALPFGSTSMDVWPHSGHVLRSQRGDITPALWVRKPTPTSGGTSAIPDVPPGVGRHDPMLCAVDWRDDNRGRLSHERGNAGFVSSLSFRRSCALVTAVTIRRPTLSRAIRPGTRRCSSRLATPRTANYRTSIGRGRTGRNAGPCATLSLGLPTPPQRTGRPLRVNLQPSPNGRDETRRHITGTAGVQPFLQ
jgi:hypothetical protein